MSVNRASLLCSRLDFELPFKPVHISELLRARHVGAVLAQKPGVGVIYAYVLLWLCSYCALSRDGVHWSWGRDILVPVMSLQ